jgi:hypothetical protein
MINNTIHIINFTVKKWKKFFIKCLATEDNEFLTTEDDKFIQL